MGVLYNVILWWCWNDGSSSGVGHARSLLFPRIFDGQHVRSGWLEGLFFFSRGATPVQSRSPANALRT